MKSGDLNNLKIKDELDRFDRNFSNWVKLDPSDVMYHRFQGMLEGQIVTLKNCDLITKKHALELHIRIGSIIEEKISTSSRNKI